MYAIVKNIVCWVKHVPHVTRLPGCISDVHFEQTIIFYDRRHPGILVFRHVCTLQYLDPHNSDAVKSLESPGRITLKLFN